MKNQILLAPLEGMTDGVFRRCFYRHFQGLDRAVAPFLSVPDHIRRIPARTFRDVALPGQSPVPEIPQLLLSSPRAFLTVGKALADAGYEEVNWNLGCPSRGVVNKGKGAGMLPRTEDVLEVLDRVLPVLPLRISLKIRLGMYSNEESFRLIRALRGYPLKELICHPRLGKDMYRGIPDLEGFSTLQDLTDLPLIYNGDILTPQEFLLLKKQFPRVSGWMIGRGLFHDPFLPERIKGLDSGPVREKERFRQFLENLYKDYEQTIPLEKNRLNWMKGLLFFVIKGSLREDSLKMSLRRISISEDYFRFLDELFQ